MIKNRKKELGEYLICLLVIHNADTITLNSLKKISKELGENMNDEELKIMLERASKNGVELTFYTK